MVPPIQRKVVYRSAFAVNGNKRLARHVKLFNVERDKLVHAEAELDEHCNEREVSRPVPV